MAKRYHQSKKDRMNERIGELKHLARMNRDRRDESSAMSKYWDDNKDPRDLHDEYHHKIMNNDEAHRYRSMGGAEHYAGMEPRRRQEMFDSGMIHEDHRAVANLPQNVKYMPYPKSVNGLPEDLDDTLRGIDRQIGIDHSQTMRQFNPRKV